MSIHNGEPPRPDPEEPEEAPCLAAVSIVLFWVLLMLLAAVVLLYRGSEVP